MNDIIFEAPTIGLWPMQKMIVEYWSYVYVLWWSVYATAFVLVIYFFIVRPYLRSE